MRAYALVAPRFDTTDAASYAKEYPPVVSSENAQKLRERVVARVGKNLPPVLSSALHYLDTATVVEQDDLVVANAYRAKTYRSDIEVELILDIGAPRTYLPSKAIKFTQDYLGDRSVGGVVKPPGSCKFTDGSEVCVAVVDGSWTCHPEFTPGVRWAFPARQPRLARGDHGNGMLGILFGTNSGRLRGMVPKARPLLRAYSRRTQSGTTGIHEYDVFETIAETILGFQKSGVLVIGLDAIKAILRNGSYRVSPRIGLEAWKAGRALFHVAAALGVIPVIAAGNGQGADLARFCSRDLYPSPAIVVGAGEPEGPSAAGGPRCRESNRGNRVDLHSWGKRVTTLTAEGFTERFSGTSSATAIVAGAAAIVQSHLVGRLKAAKVTSVTPSARQVCNLLVRHGYHQESDGIGPRPDLSEVAKALDVKDCHLPLLLGNYG